MTELGLAKKKVQKANTKGNSIIIEGKEMQLKPLLDTEQKQQRARDRTPPTHSMKIADYSSCLPPHPHSCSQPTTVPGANHPVTR